MLEQMLILLLKSNDSLNPTFNGMEFHNVALIVFIIIFACLSYVLCKLMRKNRVIEEKEIDHKEQHKS